MKIIRLFYIYIANIIIIVVSWLINTLFKYKNGPFKSR
ncbi:hypothetical protein FORC065_2982 [Yersinia enterocolitica]|nr:hypothetical protein FORC065_2982 [Yersinia enterocolitica]